MAVVKDINVRRILSFALVLLTLRVAVSFFIPERHDSLREPEVTGYLLRLVVDSILIVGVFARLGMIQESRLIAHSVLVVVVQEVTAAAGLFVLGAPIEIMSPLWLVDSIAVVVSMLLGAHLGRLVQKRRQHLNCMDG